VCGVLLVSRECERPASDRESSLQEGDRRGTGGYICTKVVTVFPSNAGTGFSGHQGVVLLASATNGQLLSIADAHEITAMRTAAASAVATRLLASRGPCVLAILGSGQQALEHAEAMRCVREISEVRVWSRTASRAQELAEKVGGVAYSTAEEAVRGADIVCTLTPSPEPILQHAWLKPSAHVNAVGSCNPRQRELDEACLTSSSAVFVDSKEACLQGLTKTG
jgi:ornithine cyclodeaminase/alanine dehydrogenase-like protein (mu-crystallin family)